MQWTVKRDCWTLAGTGIISLTFHKNLESKKPLGMEEDPTVDEKPIFKRLFEDEKPDVQALQINEETLASENKHGSCCFSKDIDWKLDLKQIVLCEHTGSCSKPAVDQLFLEGNSREQNLFPGDSSLSINSPDGSEAKFPHYIRVKQEFCVANGDSDLIKTEQSERDIKIKTQEEACIARLQAHVEASSSTLSSECKQEVTETAEDVKDNESSPQCLVGLNESQDYHRTPLEQDAEKDTDHTDLIESEYLLRTSSYSTRMQLRTHKSGRKSLSSNTSTGNQDKNQNEYNYVSGDWSPLKTKSITANEAVLLFFLLMEDQAVTLIVFTASCRWGNVLPIITFTQGLYNFYGDFISGHVFPVV
ncbi:hypothetical protein ElyMa_005660200 [Elysia marginata]|uniref:Uncharacterized protein n=1 Tax=Elysia marginata TaxID=1093978 RepID=A0AAV4FCX8_9GAST|nr:hypothetical protein ElyMa_005660200 [Elysia marginata]